MFKNASFVMGLVLTIPIFAEIHFTAHLERFCPEIRQEPAELYTETFKITVKQWDQSFFCVLGATERDPVFFYADEHLIFLSVDHVSDTKVTGTLSLENQDHKTVLHHRFHCALNTPASITILDPTVAITDSEDKKIKVPLTLTFMFSSDTTSIDTHTQDTLLSPQAIIRMAYYLESGISVMEQDSNREHEAEMHIVEQAARKLLARIMALVEIDKLEEYGIKAKHVQFLYQYYDRFRKMVEATYGKMKLNA